MVLFGDGRFEARRYIKPWKEVKLNHREVADNKEVYVKVKEDNGV